MSLKETLTKQVATLEAKSNPTPYDTMQLNNLKLKLKAVEGAKK